MKGLKRVVWAEGLFLGQQHFQAWDQYQQDAQILRSQHQNPFPWGAIHTHWDTTALINGRLELVSCTAILSDGRLIDLQQDGTPIASLDVTEAQESRVSVYLSVPTNAAANPITGYPTTGFKPAWRATNQSLQDDHDVNRQRDVLLAQPNVQLSLELPAADQSSSLKVTTLIRNDQGTYELARDDFSPCLTLNASQALQNLGKGILESLLFHLNAFKEQRKQLGDVSTFSPLELSDFLFGKDIALLYGELSDLLHQKQQSPYALYQVLHKTLDTLRCYLDIGRIQERIPYDHAQPQSVFPALETHIRTVLGTQTERPENAIQFTRAENGVYQSSRISAAVFERYSFYLAVNHHANDPSWVADFPGLCKMGAPSTMATLLSSAVPGVPLTHCQRVPQKIRIKSGYEYFRIETRTPLWETITAEGGLSAFCMGDYESADLELIVIEE